MLALCVGVGGTQNEVIHPKSCTEELAESAFEQFWLKRTGPSLPFPCSFWLLNCTCVLEGSSESVS